MNNSRLHLPFTILIILVNVFYSFSQTTVPPTEKKVKFTLPKNGVITESKEVIVPAAAPISPPSLPLEPEVIVKPQEANNAINSVAEQEAIVDESSAEEERYDYSINNLESLRKACNVNPLKVYSLQLSDDSYKSFPDEVFNFKNLKRLEIRGGRIKFLPEKIAQLKSLKKLVLAVELAELPDSLFDLSNLEELEIHHSINTLNPKIGQLTKLKKLIIPAINIPATIKNLVNLEYLKINSGSSNASIDAESINNIGLLTNLVELKIEDNAIEQIPLSFKNLKKIEKLTVSFSKDVVLNDVFNELINLKEVAFGHPYNRYNEDYDNSTNKLALTLPNSFGNLKNLTALTIGNISLNNLENGFKNLTSLERLMISSANVSALPASIGNSTLLKEITIRNSNLAKLPIEINKLTQLSTLSLEGNNLVSIPDISNLSQLKTLSLNHNKLASLTSSIGNITTLETIELNYNQLKTLPEEIGNLPYLVSIRASNNKLTTLPENIGKCLMLSTIGVDDNEITTLPASLSDCRKLSAFSIRKNKLTNLNLNFDKLNELNSLDASNNMIAKLPVGVGNLTMLNSFKVAHNKISSLPNDFVNNKSVEYVDLSNNQIETLPIEIKGWTNLDLLDLSNNKIKNISSIPLLKTKIQSNEYSGSGFSITNNPITVIPKTYNDWLRKHKYGKSQAIYNLIH